ncbi:MAG: hypothetical protein MOGMAGMI_00842 [Candidatus Omnitrophica bacterium]|nr:hypothetical protein [Candidatus Omnitrophota bacterium]
MRSLVVGYGSIGARHARVLEELGCEVHVVSRRQVDHPRRHQTLRSALEKTAPGYVVIANRTSEHLGTVAELRGLGWKGRLLIEKPLASGSEGTEGLSGGFEAVAVAYNLRLHPLLRRLEQDLKGERVLSAAISVGKYLPEWRPGTDYRRSYSASAAEGGGVLRDLSHEIDYALWLFGPCRSLTAAGGHVSSLEIASDDVYTLLLETARCPIVSVHMDYLDRVLRRQILVHTDLHSYRVDLANGCYEKDGRAETLPFDRDRTYRSEHQAMLEGRVGELCSVDEAVEVMRVIERAEKASAERVWVKP